MPAPLTDLPCSYKRRTLGPIPCRGERRGGWGQGHRSGTIGATLDPAAASGPCHKAAAARVDRSHRCYSPWHVSLPQSHIGRLANPKHRHVP